MSSKRDDFVTRRKELNLTQQQVADALGLTSRSVQTWEAGIHLPRLTPGQTLKLCRLFGYTIEDLARDFEPESLQWQPKTPGTA